MYFAVKKVINYDPAALAEQSAKAHAALDSDTQYAKLVKTERKADTACVICTVPILPAFFAATFLFSPAASEAFYAFIPLTILALNVLLVCLFRSKRRTVRDERDAAFRIHVSFAVEYYDIIQSHRIIACYGKMSSAASDMFELTIVTIPKSQMKTESEEYPAEHTLRLLFNPATFPLAHYDNLVLNVAAGTLYFEK